MYHPRTFIMRSIVSDLKKRTHLCRMIETSRERWIVEMGLANTSLDDPADWRTRVDPQFGAKYGYILCGHRRAFAVEHETGAIFGVSRNGQANRRYTYGTLDTIEKWNWAYSRPTPR